MSVGTWAKVVTTVVASTLLFLGGSALVSRSLPAELLASNSPVGSCSTVGGDSSVGGQSPVCAPVVQAQPSTHLADGQVIAVTGSGFTPAATIAVIECQTGATGAANCDLSTYELTTASSTGSISTSFIASRYLHISNPTPTTTDCAVPGACILGAANYANFSESAFTPLSFNPAAPTPPALVLGGSLSPAGSVVKKTGVATLSGTVTCNRPAFVSVSGELSQIYHRFIFTSYFYVSLLCTSTSTWSTAVQPSNGLFGRGKASVTATAYGSVDGSASQAGLSGPVTLKVSKK